MSYIQKTSCSNSPPPPPLVQNRVKIFRSSAKHIYHTHTHTLPDDGRCISRNVAEKHNDSRHDKLRKQFKDVTSEYKHLLFKVPGVPKRNFKRLIWCKLKTTTFTQSVFIFSKLSYSNLKFSIKQSKIGWKFAEQWLPKITISEPIDDRRPGFFEKFTNLRQPYCFNNVH